MRDELTTIRELYEYNSTRRKAYLRKIWRLPPKERYKDRGGSFPSLVDIFLHVLDVYRFWFQKLYLEEANVPEFPLGVRLSEAQVRREERTIDRMVRGVLADISESDLRRRLTVPWQREKPTLRVVLIHLVEEELQHRGEMNALLWQMDIDPPVEGFWADD
jgi:uncharacterized damage-inducible protein DinB